MVLFTISYLAKDSYIVEEVKAPADGYVLEEQSKPSRWIMANLYIGVHQ